MLFGHSEREKPILAERTPISKPFKVCSGLTEELKLHLFKFADAENEVSGSYFVTERFAYLTYTERKLFTSRTLNVCEVYEYALSCFRTEIYSIFCILRNALKCFEHKVKLTDVRKIVLAA